MNREVNLTLNKQKRSNLNVHQRSSIKQKKKSAINECDKAVITKNTKKDGELSYNQMKPLVGIENKSHTFLYDHK